MYVPRYWWDVSDALLTREDTLTQELKEQDIVIEKLPYNVIIFICNTIRKAIVSLKNNVT